MRTGQRQGDLLALPRSAYERAHAEGPRLHLRQSKTRARLAVPVAAPRAAALDAGPLRSPITLTNEEAKPWTADGFRSSWRKATVKAGLQGSVRFNDLRGTFVTRARALGPRNPQIGAVTGHMNAEIDAILEKHHAASDPAPARETIARLERRTEPPKWSP